jgi:hypothetical protein
VFLDVAQSLELLTTDLKPATDVHAPEPMAMRTDQLCISWHSSRSILSTILIISTSLWPARHENRDS